jgi:hypothetical protein
MRIGPETGRHPGLRGADGSPGRAELANPGSAPGCEARVAALWVVLVVRAKKQNRASRCPKERRRSSGCFWLNHPVRPTLREEWASRCRGASYALGRNRSGRT